VTTPRQIVDIASQLFNCNKYEHNAFVQQEIKNFNHAYEELSNYDNRSKKMVGLVSCFWMFNYISLGSGLLLSAAFLGLSHQYDGRPEYVKQYQDKLDNLLDISNWCIKTGGSSIVNNDAFLDLIKTLAPFVSFDDMENVILQIGISDALKQIILEQPLYSEQFSKFQQKQSKGWFSSLWSTKEDNTQIQTQKFGIYAQSCAKLKFTLYGKHDQSITEYGQQMLQPLLNFRNGRG